MTAMRTFVRHALGGAALALGLAGAALAQGYPNRTVTVVVPTATGGGGDLMGRLFAAFAEKKLGQTFVVENKAGAQTAIGAKYVAEAAPDGYTILVTPSSPSAYKALYKEPPVDTGADFDFVSSIVRSPQVIAAHPKHATFADLVAASQANPNGVVMASYGGSIHLLTLILNEAAGLNARAIQFSNAGEAAKSVAAGDADYFLASGPTLGPWDGKITRLGVTSREESAEFPGLPGTVELGLDLADLGIWIGVLVPKGTPAEAIEVLNATVREFVADPAIAAELRNLGFEPHASSPEEFRDFVLTEQGLLAEAAEKSGFEKQ